MCILATFCSYAQDSKSAMFNWLKSQSSGKAIEKKNSQKKAMTFFVNQNSAKTMVQLNLVKLWNFKLKFIVFYLTASKTSSFDNALTSCEINNYDNLFISQNVSPVFYDKNSHLFLLGQLFSRGLSFTLVTHRLLVARSRNRNQLN